MQDQNANGLKPKDFSQMLADFIKEHAPERFLVPDNIVVRNGIARVISDPSAIQRNRICETLKHGEHGDILKLSYTPTVRSAVYAYNATSRRYKKVRPAILIFCKRDGDLLDLRRETDPAEIDLHTPEKAKQKQAK